MSRLAYTHHPLHHHHTLARLGHGRHLRRHTPMGHHPQRAPSASVVAVIACVETLENTWEQRDLRAELAQGRVRQPITQAPGLSTAEQAVIDQPAGAARNTPNNSTAATPVWHNDGTKVRYHGSLDQMTSGIYRIYACDQGRCDCNRYELGTLDRWYEAAAVHVGPNSVTPVETAAT